MSTATAESAAGVRWDLSALFTSIEDPRIEQTWAEALARADQFAETYRGKVTGLDRAALNQALAEFESIVEQSSKPVGYANLLFAADTSDPKLGAFLAGQMERSSELSVKLMFFELELQALEDAALDTLAADSELANYKHFLGRLRETKNHRLTEAEEVILEEVANTGSRAWVRLFEELTANHKYQVTLPGEEEPEEMTQEEVLDLLRDPDRATRQAAADGFSAGLQQLQRTIVFIYNNLLADKRVEDRLRKHPYPEHSRHLANELDKDTVDLVMRLCKERSDLVARYYRIKKQILGLDELTHIDRYAPLEEAKTRIAYADAKTLILEAFAEFSPEVSKRAEEFFENSWIDAEPRDGKGGGAFCSSNTTDTHPVVMMSYLDKSDDAMTLAHELGHGVHASLSRAQTFLNFHSTLPLAELASIFGEMLVFESLMKRLDTADQLSLVGEKLESIFATVYRQASMFRFEQRCHTERRESGELTAERFGEIWQEELQSMFGDSITLGEQHKVWWSYVGHFFFAPFYVYAYAFGELLTLALYQRAKDEGPSFAARYEEVLRLGGSRGPHELMAIVGVDLRSEAFWQGGFSAIEALLERFEALWAQRQG